MAEWRNRWKLPSLLSLRAGPVTAMPSRRTHNIRTMHVPARALRSYACRRPARSPARFRAINDACERLTPCGWYARTMVFTSLCIADCLIRAPSHPRSDSARTHTHRLSFSPTLTPSAAEIKTAPVFQSLALQNVLTSSYRTSLAAGDTSSGRIRNSWECSNTFRVSVPRW